MTFRGLPGRSLFRFRDRELSDFALPALMAFIYFGVATDASGPALGGDFVSPLLAATAWVFCGVAIVYPVLGTYALRQSDPSFSVSVVVAAMVYAGVAAGITWGDPVFGLLFLVGTFGGTLGMLTAMHHDEREGVTRVRLVEGYVLAIIVLAVLVAVTVTVLQMAFGMSSSILETPQFYAVIAVSLFLGTVVGDYLESPSGGIVGYFAGTDAVFYSFALTSLFVLLAMWGIGGGHP